MAIGTIESEAEVITAFDVTALLESLISSTPSLKEEKKIAELSEHQLKELAHAAMLRQQQMPCESKPPLEHEHCFRVEQIAGKYLIEAVRLRCRTQPPEPDDTVAVKEIVDFLASPFGRSGPRGIHKEQIAITMSLLPRSLLPAIITAAKEQRRNVITAWTNQSIQRRITGLVRKILHGRYAENYTMLPTDSESRWMHFAYQCVVEAAIDRLAALS